MDKNTVKLSAYARDFDETNPNWANNPEWNLMFLRNIQNHMNDLLLVRGHVFLNEVYDQLGFKRTSAGAVVGWLVTDEHTSYVDFNLHNLTKETSASSILLDFNVDGIIYEKI